MFIGMIALLTVLTLPLVGGRVARLAELSLRGLPLLLSTLVVQILITDIITDGSKPVLSAAHIATYLIAGFVIVVNRRVPGMIIIGCGAATNGITIAVNGGTLPASAHALKAAGIRTHGFSNSGLVAHPKLGFLGDTMSTPSWLPFHNVISAGDLVILLGVVVLLHVTSGSRLGVAINRFRIRMPRPRAWTVRKNACDQIAPLAAD